MADQQNENDERDEGAGRKKPKAALFLGLILGLVAAFGGFYVAYSGYFPWNSETQKTRFETRGFQTDDLPDVRFVAIEPIVVSLRNRGQEKHLRFRAQLEVPPEFQADVTRFLPRIVDIINGYLRALDHADIADPSALVRIRAQILRRITTVIGQGRINDILIMEFALI